MKNVKGFDNRQQNSKGNNGTASLSFFFAKINSIKLRIVLQYSLNPTGHRPGQSSRMECKIHRGGQAERQAMMMAIIFKM